MIEKKIKLIAIPLIALLLIGSLISCLFCYYGMYRSFETFKTRFNYEMNEKGCESYILGNNTLFDLYEPSEKDIVKLPLDCEPSNNCIIILIVLLVFILFFMFLFLIFKTVLWILMEVIDA